MPQDFINKLKADPTSISFAETITAIDDQYNFTPTAFKNGFMHNEAGTNNGSCKIFAFAKLHDLTPSLTLACFGKYYFEEVLGDPKGDGHQNIRNFMISGFGGVKFKGEPLKMK